MKVLLKRFHLNGHTTGFHPQTQNLEPREKIIIKDNGVLQRVCANVTRNPITIYLCRISNTERSVLPHIKHRVLRYFTKRTGLFLTSFEVFEIVTRHSEELLFRMSSHDTVHVRPPLSLPYL